jgi:hypothetical protein
MKIREDIYNLLYRINCCEEMAQTRKGWGSSKRYIFQGCYDVMETDWDADLCNQTMIGRLNEAKELGLIMNESGEYFWHMSDNWHLTELGSTILLYEAKTLYGNLRLQTIS